MITNVSCFTIPCKFSPSAELSKELWKILGFFSMSVKPKILKLPLLIITFGYFNVYEIPKSLLEYIKKISSVSHHPKEDECKTKF